MISKNYLKFLISITIIIILLNYKKIINNQNKLALDNINFYRNTILKNYKLFKSKKQSKSADVKDIKKENKIINEEKKNKEFKDNLNKKNYNMKKNNKINKNILDYKNNIIKPNKSYLNNKENILNRLDNLNTQLITNFKNLRNTEFDLEDNLFDVTHIKTQKEKFYYSNPLNNKELNKKILININIPKKNNKNNLISYKKIDIYNIGKFPTIMWLN